jgi:hypothetical protein
MGEMSENPIFHATSCRCKICTKIFLEGICGKKESKEKSRIKSDCVKILEEGMKHLIETGIIKMEGGKRK